MAVGATQTGDTVAAGWTAGTNFPRVNPYQNIFQGGFTDGWVARVGPGADLGIAKAANRTTAEHGAQVAYTITVSNSGPDSANGRHGHRHAPDLAHVPVVHGQLGRRVREHRQCGDGALQYAAAEQLGDDHDRRAGERHVGSGHVDQQHRVAADADERPEPGQQHVHELGDHRRRQSGGRYRRGWPAERLGGRVRPRPDHRRRRRRSGRRRAHQPRRSTSRARIRAAS